MKKTIIVYNLQCVQEEKKATVSLTNLYTHWPQSMEVGRIELLITSNKKMLSFSILEESNN